jgi:hypothetical protein
MIDAAGLDNGSGFYKEKIFSAKEKNYKSEQ